MTKPLSVDYFQREVKDKLGVVFNGCNGTPLERAINRQQCEDFLVEFFTDALTDASEREAALVAENERLKGDRDEWRTRAMDAAGGHGTGRDERDALAAKDADLSRVTLARDLARQESESRFVALQSERQKVHALREWLERNEQVASLSSDQLLTLLMVKAKMDAIWLPAPPAVET